MREKAAGLAEDGGTASLPPPADACCAAPPPLVPPAGERPGIVVLTIGLEESLPKLPGAVLPSKLWSPYRLPLIRFLNQYPAER